MASEMKGLDWYDREAARLGAEHARVDLALTQDGRVGRSFDAVQLTAVWQRAPAPERRRQFRKSVGRLRREEVHAALRRQRLRLRRDRQSPNGVGGPELHLPSAELTLGVMKWPSGPDPILCAGKTGPRCRPRLGRPA